MLAITLRCRALRGNAFLFWCACSTALPLACSAIFVRMVRLIALYTNLHLFKLPLTHFDAHIPPFLQQKHRSLFSALHPSKPHHTTCSSMKSSAVMRKTPQPASGRCAPLPCRARPHLQRRSRFTAAAGASPQPQPQQTDTLTPAAVLVCPGFLADHRGAECSELAANLRRHFAATTAASSRGSSTVTLPAPQPPAIEVLPISRADWFPTLRGGSFAFYVEALAARVEALSAQREGAAVALVCLSAAGWIARLALGGQPYQGGWGWGWGACIGGACIGGPDAEEMRVSTVLLQEQAAVCL